MVHFTTCNARSNTPAKHANSFNFKKSCMLLTNSSSFKYKFSPPYGERGKAYYQEKLRKAKALKIAGEVMASVGGRWNQIIRWTYCIRHSTLHQRF